MNFTDFSRAVQTNVGRVIVGKPSIVELLLTALLVEGHVLIEDVPGTGKTTLAKALAASLDLPFARIQFTPDLLPSDVTGLSIYNQKSGEFEFRPGPVFSSVLLADEINRATPRTQSALLEAMQERQVTADGRTYPLQRPFIVLATQNPIELEGTFPLPEAQQDRFLMQVKPGYPSEAEEDEILRRYAEADPAEGLRPIATAEDVLALQRDTPKVRVHADVRAYIVRLCRATREHEAVDLGVSPRGTLALLKASQALAALRGRDFVIPSDAQHLSTPVLVHRVHISPQVRLRGRTPEQVVQEVIAAVPVPVVE
ncbi:MAG: MoxR family ATPase [Anaerolineae bacterium]|jgi:MoxR-like ATPase|nr:MoxR family ATPase [Anaerolineae bacterium]